MAELTFPEMFRLDGKVALVTGGARGLGLEMARGLAEAGAEVVLADRLVEEGEKSAEALATSGFRAHFREVDVSERPSVFRLMGEVARELGGIDVLINNAGVGGAFGGGPFPAEDLPPEHWKSLLAINLDGPFWCCQAVHPLMRARGGGSIINIVSIYGIAGSPNIRVAAYCASKGGLVNLTRQLAIEWAGDGIRVNAIAPSVFRTALGGPEGLASRKWRSHVLDRTPLRRVGEPDEVKGAAIFLASRASSMVTGHILSVDGGWLAW